MFNILRATAEIVKNTWFLRGKFDRLPVTGSPRIWFQRMRSTKVPKIKWEKPLIYEAFGVRIGFNISANVIIQMVKKKKLQFIKKKNSYFYSIMLTVMSRYKCNQSRYIYYDYLPHKWLYKSKFTISTMSIFEFIICVSCKI